MDERWLERLEALGGFGPLIAVYSGYEADASGSYEVLVERQVPIGASTSAPLHVVAVPSASYLVFQCSGPVAQAVIDGWRAVWTYFEGRDAPARAYTYDVEIYHPENPVEIWVAVRDR